MKHDATDRPEPLTAEAIEEGLRLDAARTPGQVDVDAVMSEAAHDITLVSPPAHAGNPVCIACTISDEYLPITDQQAETNARYFAEAWNHYGAALRQLRDQAAELARLRAAADKDRIFVETAEQKVREVQAERDEARAELARLRAAAEGLAAALDRLVAFGPMHDGAWEGAHAALAAARAAGAAPPA